MQYKEADKYFIINGGDKNLKPITIPLPVPPNIKKIDGYGLPPNKQFFTRQKYPPKLKALEDECGGNIDDIWGAISRRQKQYKEEIKWIKRQWYYRLYGYWCFINGKPTYIDGWHFYYLNYFHLDVGLPKYRDRDRRWFIAARYIYDTTIDFEKKDEFGNAIPEEDGTYKVYDTGRKLFWGVIGLKGRRFGDTYKSLCIGLEEITRAKNHGSKFGMQGDTGETGNTDFKYVVHAWRKLPFFFMPKYDNPSNPKEEVLFYEPARRGSNNNVVGSETGLEATINYASTADRSYYDGTKLLYYVCDEPGKTRLEDVVMRWKVVRECLSEGSERVGFSIHPTTVGEMTKGGGKRMRELCDQSDYFVRSKNGETMSSLCVLFFPAYDGLSGFVDEFGNSVIDTPNAEQSKYINKKVGAKEYLENKLSAYLKKGDEDSLRAYREQKRLYPTQYSDCFLTDVSDIGMPYEKIDARLGDLNFEREATRRGNFIRQDAGNKDSKVIWVDDNENGRFYISHMLPDSLSNQKYYSHNVWYPNRPRFTASSDPFRLDKTQHARMSKGGGACWWNFDKSIDGEKSIEHWTTNRFVCTYCYRPPTTDEFCEDMLMMCIYFGALMYGENNIDIVNAYFMRRGYGGYLKYGIDKASGKYRKTPGFSSLGESKANLFNMMVDYMQKHSKRERHKEILMECRDIRGLDDMVNRDLFTACGGCLLGIESDYGFVESLPEKEVLNMGDYLISYDY